MSALSPEDSIALLSRVFIVLAIAFGTALITCLSVLPTASNKPELVDLYVMISRFSLSGLIGGFMWYLPLVFRLRLIKDVAWQTWLRRILSTISIAGSLTVMVVLFQIVTRGAEMLGMVADRYGT